MSRVVQMPGGRRRRVKLASQNPQEFVPPIDIVNELRKDRDAYIGSDWITLCSLPEYYLQSLKTVKEHIPGKPGINPTVSCCVAFGVPSFREQKEIKDLLELKTKLYTAKGISAELVNAMTTWYDSFPMAVPNPSGDRMRRRSVALPTDVKQGLSELAGDLGMTQSDLAVLSIGAILSIQKDVMEENAEEMAKSVEAFLERASVRCTVGWAMFKALGKIGKKPSHKKGIVTRSGG